MNRLCEACGAAIPPRKGPGGKRKRCPACSPSRNRGKRTSASVTVLPNVPEGETVTEATRNLLSTHVGALEHPMGRTALVLASRIDSSSESTPSIVAAGKQLDSCLRSALEATAPVKMSKIDQLRQGALLGDPIDEIRLRIAERGAGSDDQ